LRLVCGQGERRAIRRFLIAGVAVSSLLGAVQAVFALQEPGGDPLDAVRKLAAFTSAEDQAIDGWLTARINDLKSAASATPTTEPGDAGDASAPITQPEVLAAGQRLLAAFQAQLQHPENTPEFVARFSQRAGAVMGAQLASTDEATREIAWYFARALLETGRIETREALLAGLSHPAAAVRWLCATGLKRLQPAIGSDPNVARATLRALETAGTAETDPQALGAIYRAIGLPDHSDDATRTLNAIFAARIGRRHTRQVLMADRAEMSAWDYLLTVRGRLNDAEKVPLVRNLALFLVLDVDRFPAAGPDEQSTVRQRIEVGEELLDSLARGSAGNCGNVRKVLKADTQNLETDIRLELFNWVGAEGVEGCLNKAPWNLPVGGFGG